MKKYGPILALLGILLAVGAYYGVFRSMEEKTKELETQCIAMEADIAKYKEWEQNKDYYVSETERMSAEIAERIKEFPSYNLPEDAIKLAYEMDNRSNTNFMYIDSINFADPVPLYTADYSSIDLTEAGGVIDPNIPYPIYVLWKLDAIYGIDASYDGLKQMISNIQAQNDRKGIESVALSMDSSTGLLSGSVIMNSYYVDGSEKPYAQPSLMPVIKGTENPFGTLDAPEMNIEAEEEADSTAN